MSWPDKYRDFVKVFGGLHTEMAVLKIRGKLLQSANGL